MDLLSGYVVEDEEREECYAVIVAAIAEVLDDFDVIVVGVASIFAVANAAVSAVGNS